MVRAFVCLYVILGAMRSVTNLWGQIVSMPDSRE